MAKAATSGQARAFNAMTVSRIDEETLKQIDSEKFQKAIDKPEEFISNFIAWINNGCGITQQVVARILKNLTFVCEIIIGNVAEFVVGEKFQYRAKDKVGIQLWISDNFMNWLIKPIKNKKVSLTEGKKLEKLSLVKPMHDTEIQIELQNLNLIAVEIFLPLLWNMLSLQKNGEEKEDGLLTNGYANIFHVKLEDKSVVAVDVHWSDDEWDLDAMGFGYAFRWGNGRAFFTPATVS